MARHAVIRPSIAEDFIRLKAKVPPKSVRAFTVLRDEEVIAIAGIYKDGASTVLFSELTDEFRSDKRLMVRFKRVVMPMLRPRTLSLADPAIPGSEVLLEHMGFEPYEGRVYLWPG